MELNNTFSLSLQKQISKQKVVIDSEINSAFKELKFRSLLNRSGIRKARGYTTITLLFLVVLLPFIKRKLTDIWNSEYLNRVLSVVPVRSNELAVYNFSQQCKMIFRGKE